ncbi:MAG TPA: uroporphyrinogen decarboxylase family protein [Anaerolineales bacterium]|nr:uroporphyrinogen decarboxylase family protein [Anaerolineales bacterium]
MPETMTPRERVHAVLNHREPDRVPVTLGGSANHLSEERYNVLRDHFGFQDVPRRTLVGFYTTPDYNPLLDCLKTDFRFLHIRPPQGYISNPVGPGFQEFVDEWGLRHRLVSGYYDMAGAPLAKDLSIEAIDKFPWPDPYKPERLAGLQAEAEDLYNNTSFALVGHRPVYGNLWEMTRVLVGMENALLLTVTDTKLFDHLLGVLADVLDGFYDAFLNAVGPYIQVIEFADDYGTNVGPMFNPEVYKKYLKPRYKKSIELIKKKAPQVKVMLHCDGAIRKFLPDLIETGFDILNPIEWHLKGMDPVGLKRDFGKDLTFNGGVDVKHVLTQGTVEDVRREVRLRIEQMGKDGGYILAPAHNFTNDMPLRNLLAFFEAAQELGFYPL